MCQPRPLRFVRPSLGQNGWLERCGRSAITRRVSLMQGSCPDKAAYLGPPPSSSCCLGRRLSHPQSGRAGVPDRTAQSSQSSTCLEALQARLHPTICRGTGRNVDDETRMEGSAMERGSPTVGSRDAEKRLTAEASRRAVPSRGSPQNHSMPACCVKVDWILVRRQQTSSQLEKRRRNSADSPARQHGRICFLPVPRGLEPSHSNQSSRWSAVSSRCRSSATAHTHHSAHLAGGESCQCRLDILA